MMINWKLKPPNKNGIFWFDGGYSHHKERSPLILHIKGDYNMIFGEGGSVPLNFVYDKRISIKARFANIKKPDTWVNGSEVKNFNQRSWIMHPDGYTGFGIISVGEHNDIRATIAWLAHPNQAFESNTYIKNNNGYLYCLVNNPIII